MESPVTTHPSRLHNSLSILEYRCPTSSCYICGLAATLQRRPITFFTTPVLGNIGFENVSRMNDEEIMRNQTVRSRSVVVVDDFSSARDFGGRLLNLSSFPTTLKILWYWKNGSAICSGWAVIVRCHIGCLTVLPSPHAQGGTTSEAQLCAGLASMKFPRKRRLLPSIKYGVPNYRFSLL